MRDINDLKNAIGDADDGFKNNVYRTLDDLKKCEERKPMKKMNLRLIAVVAVLCLLTTTVVLAVSNTWGILDFLNSGRNGVEVLPDVAKIMQTDLPQKGGESELATFSVREAIFDGQNIYIVVEAKPARPDYLLLGSDAMLTDPIGNMGPLFKDKSSTINEYVQKNDKTPIHISVALNAMDYSSDFMLEADGTLLYMINGPYADDVSQLTLELNCTTAPFVDGSVHMEEIQSSTLTATLQNNKAQNTVTNANTAEYADCGVLVDKITLTGSPMAIYAMIEFTVIDEAKFAETDSGLWFEFIDENGNRLPDGASLGGSCEPADDSGIHYIQTSSIGAAETLPSEIILRGYNCWEKNRYETHTFKMK